MERSDSDHFGFSVRNVKSAQNQFPVITQAERMVDRTGEPVEEMIAEERESSCAQIRTLLNEQRKTIIAEYCEKVSHHELLAAQAEQERRILQGELLRQQHDFREVHQQDLIKMKELQKFQNSTFDELTRQKFIENQKTIMELSGRLQELQNVDQSVGFGVPRNTYSAYSKFSENTQAEKVVDRSVKLEERNSSNAQIRTLLEEQRQMIIAENCEKIGHHELQAAYAEEERRILRDELWRQQMDFREVHQQSLTEMEELRKFQSSTFDTLARRRLIEDQNTILELSGRVQELQNEVNCMNDSKDFQDAKSVRSGNSHVTSQPGVFPKHPPFEGLLKPAFISQRHTDGPPNIWDTSGISGNVLAHPQTSSSAPYPQELNSTWRKTIEEPIHMSTAEKSGRPERDQDLRCQSGPSAKDSVIFSGGDYSKNYGADQQRLQISDLHFDKFPTPATFACWKIRFKTCRILKYSMRGLLQR